MGVNINYYLHHYLCVNSLWQYVSVILQLRVALGCFLKFNHFIILFISISMDIQF
jgi:hypothetical protein